MTDDILRAIAVVVLNRVVELGYRSFRKRMPNWKDLIDEARELSSTIGSPFDVLRRKYVRRYAHLVRRNVITYYSGWLQKPELERQGVPFGLNDADKGAFMA